MPGALDKSKLSAYGEWAAARLRNDEDPRDPAAFVAHLGALGADWRQPHEYGLPRTQRFGAATTGALDKSKLRAYAEWSAARLENDEDPRDVAAFAEHLRALGADARQPHEYGLPFGLAAEESWAPIDLQGKLPILNLGAWPGSRPYGPRDVSEITGATIHFTAGGYDVTPRAIAAYQVSGEAAPQTGVGHPFPGIAYTLLVDGQGQVHLCHDLGVRVWHSSAVVNGVSRNRSHVGICFTGHGAPRPAQIEGIARAIVWCERRLGRRLSIEGHRDGGVDTGCPGTGWPSCRAALLSAVAGARQLA